MIRPARRRRSRAATIGLVPALALTLALTLTGCATTVASVGAPGPAVSLHSTAGPGPTGGLSATATPPTPASTAPTYPLSLQVGPNGSKECSSTATGRVAAYLVAHKCQSLARTLYSTTADGHPVLVSAAVVVFFDPTVPASFVSLITSNGTGDIATLLVDGGSEVSGHSYPTKFAADPTFLAQAGPAPSEVDVLEAMWLDSTATHSGDPTLTDVLSQAATAVNSGANSGGACPSVATLQGALSQLNAAGTITAQDLCSGDWAVAFPSQSGNEFTQLFQRGAGQWRAVDRSGPCTAHEVPADIEQPACESN